MSSETNHHAEGDGDPLEEKGQDFEESNDDCKLHGNVNGDFHALQKKVDNVEKAQAKLNFLEQQMEEKLHRMEEAHDELRALIGEEKRRNEEKFDHMERAQDERFEEMKEMVEQQAEQAERPSPQELRGTFTLGRVGSTLALGNSDESSLEPDTFSIMMVSKVFSQGWALGLASFAFQITLGMMIAIDQISESADSSLFDVPFKVDHVVAIGQVLSIILCLATQNDILVPIRNFIRLGGRSNWDEVIGEDGNRSLLLWWIRIALPNLMQILTGLLITLVSLVIIVQADNIIDLLKDFTALMIISEVDNILFQLAAHGYLSDELSSVTVDVEDTNVSSTFATESLTRRRKNVGIIFVRLVFLLLLAGMFGIWGLINSNQRRGIYLERKFPHCKEHAKLALDNFGDGVCYGGPLNTLDCKFEDSDCVDFNLAFPLCKGENLLDVQNEVGNDICNELFAIQECDFDGGDCCSYEITKSPEFGDGQCNAGKISTKSCGYDGGDCNDFAREFPNCPFDDIAEMDGISGMILGNGICEGVAYASELCGREYRDCDVGQLGQDITFRGVSSGSSLDFKTMINDDGSKLMIGLYKTDVGDVFNSTSTGQVRFFGYDEEDRKWSKFASDLIGENAEDRFGFAMSQNSDMSQIVVGSFGHDSQTGKVEVYRFNAQKKEWTQFGQTLYGPPSSWWGGFTVDMTEDGSRIAFSSAIYKVPGVGRTGKVQIFDMSPSKQLWEQVGQDIHGDRGDIYGFFYVKLNSAGSRVYISSNYYTPDKIACRVYEYKTLDNEWAQLGEEIPNPYPHHFQSPAISADGNRVVVGSYTNPDSPRNGKVEVFDLDMSSGNATWTRVGPVLTRDDNTEPDGFGFNVEMSADGTLLAIGTTNPTCLGSPEWCATGSIQLYRYSARNPPHRLFSRVPFKLSSDAANVMLDAERENDRNIFGWDMSLSKDGSKISVSGYDILRDFGFVKVYEVDDLFYPECNVPDPERVGDGLCEIFDPYFTAQCSYDGGDCPKASKVEGYPNCYVEKANSIGNGICNDIYPDNSEDCGYDGGDCGETVEVPGLPGCFVSFPSKLGDGSCLDQPPYNSIECGFDNGDCLPPEFKPTPAPTTAPTLPIPTPSE